MKDKTINEFFKADNESRLYELTNSQMSVVNAYYDCIEQNLLEPLFSNQSDENKKQLHKDLKTLLGKDNKVECLQYFNSHFSKQWQFLLTPILAILDLKKGIIPAQHALNAALDYRLSSGHYDSNDKSEEKLAIGNYLISLINEYINNVDFTNAAISDPEVYSKP